MTQYNGGYVSRLQCRASTAYSENTYPENRGPMYLSVMLFQGWSVENFGVNVYDYHPFHLNNNINGINGNWSTTYSDGGEMHSLISDKPMAVFSAQDNYVRHIVQSLNGYDNILWEIANESPGSLAWQNYIAQVIRDQEATLPKRHLVWISAPYRGTGNLAVYNSAAEVVSPTWQKPAVKADGTTVTGSPKPGSAYQQDPPVTSGAKIVVLDTDHLEATCCWCDRAWVWKAFTRGYHLALLEDDPTCPANRTNVRKAINQTLVYSKTIRLVDMAPQSEDQATPCSTRYCLYTSDNPDPVPFAPAVPNGKQYLVFKPSITNQVTIYSLPAGDYSGEWENVNNSTVSAVATFTHAGGNRTLTSPYGSTTAVLFLKRNGVTFICAPSQTPPTSRFTFTCSLLSCSFDGAGSTGTGLTYAWSFGDSASGSGVNTSHPYAGTGAYTATLTVTDGYGQQSSKSKKVSVTDEIPVAAESFFTVPPCRIANTIPLTNGVPQTFQVTNLCGIPMSAKAVSFNVTVVSPTGPGHLVFYPGNQTPGPFDHATINFDPANSPRSNNAILRLATNGGTINVLPAIAASPGQVQVSLDVYGYFSEDATPVPGAQGPLGFQTLTPCRIADTRDTGTPIAADTTSNFTVQGKCNVPFGAAAAVLNPAVITPTAGGQATLFQAGTSLPVPTINFNSGVVLTNGARIRLAPITPDVSLQIAGASTHAVIDVFGYFSLGAPLKYRPITACRAVDTRFADQGGPVLAAPDNRNFQVRGNCGVPLSAKAVAVNITTVGAAGGGYLVAYPSCSALPLASYLTFDPGQGALGNGGIVTLSTLPDDLTVTTANSTHVIIDVFGYFQ